MQQYGLWLCRWDKAQPPSGCTRAHERKKAIPQDGLFTLINAWQFPTLAWGDPTLPSALRRFTSEFGMGSGGTTALRPPGKFFVPLKRIFYPDTALASLVNSVTYLCMLLPFLRLPPSLSVKSFVFAKSVIKAENRLSVRQNIFGVVRLSLTVH